MKRFLVSLLLILSVLFQSCGLIVVNEKKDSQTDEITDVDTQTQNVTTDEEKKPVSTVDLEKRAQFLLDKLPDISFENEVITIYTTDDTFFSGDGRETVLNSDRIARIRKVEEKYDLTFRTVKTSAASAFDEVAAEYKTGTAPGHIFALPMDVTASLVSEGYLKSLRTSPYFDEKAEYFNSATSTFTLGNDIFAVSGDGCFEPDKLSGLYYNKTDIDSLGLESIAGLVKNGEWTLDKFYEYLKSASSYEGTLICNNIDAKYNDILLFSSFAFTQNKADKPVRFLSFDERFKNICEDIGSLSEFKPATNEDFASGNVLFLTDSLAKAESLVTMEDVWSIAPHPKYDKESSYMSFATLDSIALSLPAVTANTVQLGAVISAINAASSGYMIQKYIDTNMNHYLRDNGAVTAFHIIIKNANYDFGYIFAGSYPKVNKYTMGAYASLVKGDMTFEKYVESYEKESGEYLDKHFPAKYY